MVARPGTHLWRHQAVRWLSILGLSLAVAGCSAPLGDYHDDELSLTQDDYSNLIGSSNTTLAEQIEPEAPPIPELLPTLVAPVPPSGGENRLVSISVTDSVPLRDVLLELARAAEVDVEIDPTIEGGIIFTANNKPFIDVIERIANMGNLRYTFKGGVLRIELDRPYNRSYKVDQLALARTSESRVDVSTDVFSSVGDNGGGNGSSANIEQSTSTDFYTDLVNTIDSMLRTSNPRYAVEDLQLVVGDDADQADGDAETDLLSSVSAHRQAGMVTVFASQKQHRMIQEYILELMEQVGSQVLIEAKILEVNLSDEFKAGINWSAVADVLLNNGIGIDFQAGGDIINGQSQDFIELTYSGGDFSAVADLLHTFGTTRTLSNPRLSISNNQPALLKVAQNQVYFTIEVDSETTEFGITRTFESTVNTVPIGLIMMVQPSINLDSNTVTLSLRPSLSRVIDFVDDPAVAIASENEVQSQIPVTEIREFDSVVSAKSGEVVILGGLMQEVSENDEIGVPFFDQLPWVGHAFKASEDDREVSELVIFLRATIVRQPLPDPADIDLYATFAIDPRPLTF